MILPLFILIFSLPVFAGRPLITDDADVIGDKRVQLETWVFADKRSYQHWIVPTLGIGDSVEVSASGVQGTATIGENKGEYTNSGPIIQGKVLFPENIAFAGGFIPPLGSGDFKTAGWDYFFYFASTLRPANKNFFFHLNLGAQTKRQKIHSSALLWGVAVEYKAKNEMHVFAESANGDVYAFIPGIAFQLGLRYDLKENFQVDGSIGRGVSGSPILPFWATLGIRLVI